MPKIEIDKHKRQDRQKQKEKERERYWFKEKYINRKSVIEIARQRKRERQKVIKR